MVSVMLDSVAKLYALCVGFIEQKRILSEEILQLATRSNTPDDEIDAVLQLHTRFSMGFSLFDQFIPQLAPGVFGTQW